MGVCGGVCAWLCGLVLVMAGWALDEGAGLQLPGDYSISGLFPLHNSNSSMSDLPALASCEE